MTDDLIRLHREANRTSSCHVMSSLIHKLFVFQFRVRVIRGHDTKLKISLKLLRWTQRSTQLKFSTSTEGSRMKNNKRPSSEENKACCEGQLSKINHYYYFHLI